MSTRLAHDTRGRTWFASLREWGTEGQFKQNPGDSIIVSPGMRCSVPDIFLKLPTLATVAIGNVHMNDGRS